MNVMRTPPRTHPAGDFGKTGATTRTGTLLERFRPAQALRAGELVTQRHDAARPLRNA